MKTLILTDLQHDFMPGGVLAVPGADQIVPIVNRIMPKFDHLIATLDWHPPHHVSFADTHGKKAGEKIVASGIEQILWPVHCVQNTWGAKIVEGLHQERIEQIFHKGLDPKIDSYSAFFDNQRHRSTGLGDYLRKHKLLDLYFVGVATDYCVLYSILDALELGFQATVIADCCRAINLRPGDEKKALSKMQEKGARIALSSEFLL